MNLTSRSRADGHDRPQLLRGRWGSAASIGMVMAWLGMGCAASAQISFTSAVDMAISSSPKVHMAEADLEKARAVLSESHDVYLPIVHGVMDLGYSYGAPLGEPTLFSFDAHSLVFSYSQRDYIRASVSGLAAANASLEEAREEVAEDAAVTYLALNNAQQRRAALAEEYGDATQLAKITQTRLDAGQDTALELHEAQRTGAQIYLQMLALDDEIDGYRSHLARIDGLPGGSLFTEPGSIPALPEIGHTAPEAEGRAEAQPVTPAVAAAEANARAKQQQAFGDSRYLYRPQVGFFADYSRFSTFNNYQTYYPAFSNHTLNAIGIGVQISIPFYDRLHLDHARESAADAEHARQEVVSARDQVFEGRVKLSHAEKELSARAELARIDQEIAQDQLDAILTQMQTGTGDPSAPQPNQKDEEKARIQERQKYLDLLDAKAKLQETQVQMLRLTGHLDAWVKSAFNLHPAPAADAVPAAPR